MPQEMNIKILSHKHLGHSSNYLKDGINALNTAFLQGALFIHIKEKQIAEHPVYIYNITDARSGKYSLPTAQPCASCRNMPRLQLVETYATIGQGESFTNQVMEIVVEKDAQAGIL